MNLQIWSVYWSIYGLCIAGVVISIIGLIGAISRKKTVIATFLVLIVPYILIQFGGSITIWTKRGTLRRLIYRFANDIYLTNSLFDISIIQNTVMFVIGVLYYQFTNYSMNVVEFKMVHGHVQILLHVIHLFSTVLIIL